MSAAQELLSFGIFELNLATEELRKSGMLIKLSPQPFQLLVMLASQPGQMVTREAIHAQLWSVDSEVDFEHGVRQCIAQVRTALGDNADSPRFVETVPRRGYRFLAPVHSKTVVAPQPRVEKSDSSGIESDIASRVLARIEASAAAAAARTPEVTPIATAPARESGRRVVEVRVVAAFVVLIVLVAGGLYWHAHKASALTEKDTIVIAEFDNKTGDPVFDGTLRQGLTAQLAQSPFLNILSDRRIAKTLALMTQPKDSRLTPELAREVCIRTQSAAALEGTITMLGGEYVVGLKAVNCGTGDEMAVDQFTVNHKENILPALGKAASRIRVKLGESGASIKKFDVPLEDVTTSSLEALKAYSLGYQAYPVKDDYVAAIPFFQQAVSLDPNFAMAYARLGKSYFNRGEPVLAAENARKAYEFRDRVSEREKFYIVSQYEQFGTGDLEAARRTYELWAQMYPRDEVPAISLGNVYQSLGEYEKALETVQKGLKLDPSSALSYGDVVGGYISLNRLDEAVTTAQEAKDRNLDSPFVHFLLYFVRFLQQDEAAAQREVALLMGKPGWEDLILFTEANTAAFAGHMAQSRKLRQMAVESALHQEEKETAAGYESYGAVVEALMGNKALARQRALAGLALSKGKDAQGLAAIAVALVGDAALATKLADDLDQRFPEDTIVQSEYLPMIRAGITLGSGRASSDAEKGIAALTAASPYELGTITQSVGFGLHPVYLRGEAYLAARQGTAASTEFHKVIDYSGVVANQPIGALAHLGLGRAYALSGDTVKAKAAYQDFLTLWKDADPDIPIYKQAKAEFAKLQQPGESSKRS